MITSLILLNLHSHWFSWLTNPVTTYVHLLIFNLSTDLLKTVCLWLTTKFTSICWSWSAIPLDIDMPRVDALLRASTSYALYRCPANSPARLLLQLHTQGNQCWWNTHTSLKNNMLAFVHAHEKVVNIRPVLHNYPSQSEAGLGITTSFGIRGGSGFPKNSDSNLSEQQPAAPSSLIHKRSTFHMILITQMKEHKWRNLSGCVAQWLKEKCQQIRGIVPVKAMINGGKKKTCLKKWTRRMEGFVSFLS